MVICNSSICLGLRPGRKQKQHLQLQLKLKFRQLELRHNVQPHLQPMMVQGNFGQELTEQASLVGWGWWAGRFKGKVTDINLQDDKYKCLKEVCRLENREMFEESRLLPANRPLLRLDNRPGLFCFANQGWKKLTHNQPRIHCILTLSIFKQNSNYSFIPIFFSYCLQFKETMFLQGLNALISPSIYEFFRRPYHGTSDLINTVRDLAIFKQQEVTHCFLTEVMLVFRVRGQRTSGTFAFSWLT